MSKKTPLDEVLKYLREYDKHFEELLKDKEYLEITFSKDEQFAYIENKGVYKKVELETVGGEKIKIMKKGETK